MPRDRYGRPIRYLRISLTDHCNLRCVYCMPLRGLEFASEPELLTADELEVVARAAAGLGFCKIRLTGGEPTLRADLLDIVRRISRVDGIVDLSLTTNGVLLPKLAGPLKEAGLHRVNIHVDTLDASNLKRIMRFSAIDPVRSGIEAAEEVGLTPVKLNAVVARGYNDADVVDMARLTLSRDWHVRFIELMPLGGGECAQLALSQFVPSAETRSRIESAIGPLTPIPACDPSDESRNYRLAGAQGVVGLISPVSEPYCGTCSRMRLTADGKFHLCLLHDEELDVKAALRNGRNNGQALDAVAAILQRAVEAKPVGHQLDEGVSVEARGMFQLGG